MAAPDDAMEPSRADDDLDFFLRKLHQTGDSDREESVFDLLDAASGEVPRVLLRDRSTAEDSTVPSDSGAEIVGRHPRYRVYGEIARGGAGVILKGRDADLGRDIAIKTLLDRHTKNPGMIRRLIEEAQIGGQLQHPGILPVYQMSVGRDKRPYFTMKLVKGQTLAELLAARTDPSADLRRYLSIFEQVCQTVAYAHARAVIHRDLKPSNIMIGSFGEVHVLDWGLAKVLADGGAARETEALPTDEMSSIEHLRSGVSESTTGSVMGTLAYMPPEQARGEIDQLDERSDVFSLGAILCEILTGQPAYVAPSKTEIRRKAECCDLDEALERLGDNQVDAELAAIARRCIAPASCSRPRDASVVAQGIAEHLSGIERRARAAEIEASSAKVRALAERRARRLTLALAVAVLSAVFLAGAGYLWSEHNRLARSRELALEVDLALAEAHLEQGRAQALPLQGHAHWTRALNAARRAQALAQAIEVDDGTLRRADEALQSLRTQAEEATGESEMVARLDEIGMAMADGLDHRARDANILRAFARHGLNLADMSADEVARRIRASSIRQHLIDALRDWLVALRLIQKSETAGIESEKLRRIVELADPDPGRVAFLGVVLDQGLDKLRDLARSDQLDDCAPELLGPLAVALRSHGDFQGAIAVYRRAARLDPDSYWIHHNLGKYLHRMRPPDLDGALRHYTAACSIRPGSADIWHHLGEVHGNAGRRHQAVFCFRRSVELGWPDKMRSAIAYRNLGRAYAAIGDFDRAIYWCDEAIRTDPACPWCYVYLALIQMGNGRFDAAIAAYQAALDRGAGVESRHEFGEALASKGDFAAAIECFEQCLEIDPSFAKAHASLAYYRYWQGNPEPARSAALEAIRLAPGDHQAHTVLGMVLADEGQHARAAASFREAIANGSRDVYAHFGLGRMLAIQGDVEGAVEWYRKATDCAPEYAQAWCNLGLALRKLGRLDDAVRCLRRGHALGSKQNGWAYPSARWVASTERTLERETRLLRVVDGDIDPADASEIARAAGAASRAGRHQEAVQMFTRAFAEDARLSSDLDSRHRYLAACSALSLLDGVDADDAGSADSERAKLLARALEWLAADLDLLQTMAAAKGSSKTRAVQTLEGWLKDEALAAIREAQGLAMWNEVERKACHVLWARVHDTLGRASL